MAKVYNSSQRSVYKADRWLGVNENPDGDTRLKPGEAAVMRNFKISDDGHLKLRPGSKTVINITYSPVRALWAGYVDGLYRLLAAAGGRVWLLDPESGSKTDLGAIFDAPTHFFGFSGSVYILNGSEYKCWNGSGNICDVAGYVPLVAVSTPPEGGGYLLEPLNKLTNKKRQRFSPDGSASIFRLAESAVSAVDWVKLNGNLLSGSEFAVSLTNGYVSINQVPPAGVNTLEVQWSKGADDRKAVASMRFSETYNGLTDTRVFLYGDGSNHAYYSGVNENGLPDASYFPDLNVLDIDSANMPITAMIKHFDKLLAFKLDGLWAAEYGAMTLSDGSLTAGFYTIPINREIGNSAMGQVRLVANWPRSIFGRSLYTWAMSSGSVRDERTAVRFSRRIEATLRTLDLSNAVTFDDEFSQELFIFTPSLIVVYNYGNDTFYFYKGLDITAAVSFNGELYFGSRDGRLLKISQSFRNDDGREIDAYWESGSMHFSKEWRKKYISQAWITIKPESGARVSVSMQGGNSADFSELVANTALTTFKNLSFSHFAFGTNHMPKSIRIKRRVRGFVFEKLIFKSFSPSATATIIGADIEVGLGGKVK